MTGSCSTTVAEAFGYRDLLLAEAIRRLTHPDPQSREPGDVALQAWPTYGVVRPTMTFDVPYVAMEELYAKNDSNRAAIRMPEGAADRAIGDRTAMPGARLPVVPRRVDSVEIEGDEAGAGRLRPAVQSEHSAPGHVRGRDNQKEVR